MSHDATRRPERSIYSAGAISIPVEQADDPAVVEDNVNHPSHYNWHPSGVECVVIAEAFGYNVGNAIKYLWRCDHKRDAVEDLKKARWYIDREIQRRAK